MRGRARIRWRNVAKLAFGAAACLALLVGLPSLIRRPKPPPLGADVGLAPAAAAPTGVESDRRRRRAPQRGGHQTPSRTAERHPGGQTSRERGHPRKHRAVEEGEEPRGRRPSAAPPLPVSPTQTVYAPSPLPPRAAMAPASTAPEARSEPQSAGRSEFGFEH